jgi:hypothetical protein
MNFIYLLKTVLGSTGIWTQGFVLAKHALSTWATPSALFADPILGIGSPFFPGLTSTVILLFYTSRHHWDDRSVLSHPAFSIQKGSHKLFLSRLALNLNHPNFSLQGS